MTSKQEYTFNDAIRDAIDQQRGEGQPSAMMASANPKLAEELAAITNQPAPTTDEAKQELIVEALRTVYDPELPVNLYDLGLIYDIKISGEMVTIQMTLTAPGCPVAGEMPGMVEYAVRHVPGVETVKAELVWDPPWDKSRMSEAAMLELGFL